MDYSGAPFASRPVRLAPSCPSPGELAGKSGSGAPVVKRMATFSIYQSQMDVLIIIECNCHENTESVPRY